MPTVHLICGPTGAGKTTYAIALAARLKGVRLSIDDWMANLFMADQPVPLTLAWAVERTERCETQIWKVVDQVMARGMDVVLDLGFSKREHRDRSRVRAMQTNGSPKLHYLDVDQGTRRARVERRNAERSGTYAFDVTSDMFDFMEQWFEPPSDDELYGAMIVCDG